MFYFTFEDCGTEPLPSFYNKFYSNEVITWTGGNGQLWNRVGCEKRLTDFEIIFIDCNPWNESIFNTYKKMHDYVRRFGYHYIIIPIVCIEYNFINSLTDKYLLDIDVIFKLRSVKTLEEIQTAGIYTYEDYCKRCAEMSVIPIASTNKEWNPELIYFNRDTLNDTLCDKWFRFILTYKLFPRVSMNLGVRLLESEMPVDADLKEICDYQNKRVELFNEWVKYVGSDVKRMRPITADMFK